MNQSITTVINGRNCYMGAYAPVLTLIAFYAAFNDRNLVAVVICLALRLHAARNSRKDGNPHSRVLGIRIFV